MLSTKKRTSCPSWLTEVLGDGQTREGDAGAGSGGLVHLAVDQGGLVENAGLHHFVPEVVPFAGTLANPGEDREAAVLLGDVVDQFHDQNRLADAGAAEEADFAAAGVGGEEVDDLDAGLEGFDFGRLLDKLRSRTMDLPGQLGLRPDRARRPARRRR